MFINHNQNPEKESVKITVGRLLVVSGTAPLSQREGALMPSPGLGSPHIWPIRGKLGGPRNQWEDREQLWCTPLVMALPGTNNGPKWWKWRKELAILEVTSLTLLFYCRKLYDIEHKIPNSISFQVIFRRKTGKKMAMNRKLKDEWLYEILMRRCKIFVTCFPQPSV